MTNQVDQFYVVNKDHNVRLAETKRGEQYFTYDGAVGALRSDLIKKGQATEVKLTTAAKQAIPLHKVTVTLADPSYLIIGEDYQIKIAIKQFQDMAEDSVYYKYGFAHAVAGMTEGLLYETLVKSLCHNFAREITKFFLFGLTDGTDVDIYDKYGKSTGKDETGATSTTIDNTNATGIVIFELAQDWNLGLMPKCGVNFDVYTDAVMVSGVPTLWGTVSKPVPYDYIQNGYTIADMEYFYMGERGDQYRMFAKPQDRINTKLLVDPTDKYDVINIHYYFVDSLGGAQKSEKDITIVIPDGETLACTDAGGASYTSASALASAIATAVGCPLVTIS